MKPLGQNEADLLAEAVRYRIAKRNSKSKPFGTPGNPRAPTVEEFNPRIGELNAGDIGRAIKDRKHGIFPEQSKSISKMSNEELIRFRPDDPISGVIQGDGFTLRAGITG